MCHNLEVSSSVPGIREATATPPITQLILCIDNFFSRIPGITTKVTLVASKPESTKLICRPFPTRTPSEIDFASC